MDFQNPTPFPSICFSALNKHDLEFHVVPLKATFDLCPSEGPDPNDCTHRMVLSSEQGPMTFADAYYGELNQSSVKWESDLAPEKPQCDIIVVGQACAPRAKPTPGFDVRLAVDEPRTRMSEPEAPRGLSPIQDPSAEEQRVHEDRVAWSREQWIPGERILDRTLRITGPRAIRLKRWPVRWFWGILRLGTLGLIRRNPWKITRPEPCTQVPLRFEQTFGGQCRVEAEDRKSAQRVPKKHRLTLDQRDAHPESPKAPAAHSACLSNPFGKGFCEAWWLKATRARSLEAPQIEDPAHPLTAKVFWRALRGKKTDAKALTPRGMGVITKAWQPRIALAGTYDEAWIQERHPKLPKDFDFAYWNGAALQMPYPMGDEILELTNLVPSDTPGARLDEAGNTVLRVQLPGWLVGASLTYTCETPEDVGSVLDTIILDLEQMKVLLTWRVTAWRDEKLLGIETFVDPEGRKGEWWKGGAA